LRSRSAPVLPRTGDGLSPTWFWITAGTAGAFALAGAITGGLELADEDTFNNAADRCNAGDDASCAAARTVYATIEDEADATTALLVVAGVAAAAAVTLIFSPTGAASRSRRWR
jgi:hypothetical protein